MVKAPRIFMFEDDKFLLGMYVKFLEQGGFSVMQFEYPPPDAVEIIAREKPDVISTGIIMPKTSGFDLVRKIKADSRTRSIPIYILSNLGTKEDIDLGLSLGVVKYFVKANHSPREIVNEYRRILGLPPLTEPKPESHQFKPPGRMPPYTDIPPDDEINRRSI